MMTWLSPRRFLPAERRWIFFYFLVLSILTTLPYVVFWELTPANDQYTWVSSFYYDDYFQYFAWARRIAHGDFLIRNYYTSSPEGGFALFNPYFLVMGWMARLTGSVYFAYHALRIAGIGAFSYILYALLAIFLRDPRARRAASLLVLGGGFEFPYYLYLDASRPASPLADPYIYKILYRYGHLTFALTLMLIVIGFYTSYLRQTRELNPNLPLAVFRKTAARRALVPSACLAILGLLNPYYLVLTTALIGVHAVLWSIPTRRMDPLLFGVPLLAGAAPPAFQYAFQSITGNLGSISFDDPIGPLDFMLFFGALLPFAVAGLAAWTRAEREFQRAAQEDAFQDESAARLLPENIKAPLLFLVSWVVVVSVLILTPLAFRARMTFGMQIPLAILAAVWLSRRRLLAWTTIPLAALLLMDAGFTFYKEYVDLAENGVGRVDKSLMAAFESLDARAKPGDVVVTTPAVGCLLPAYVSANVYAGHSFQTDHFYDKERELTRLFLEDTPAEATAWLKNSGADYLLVPPVVRARNPKFAVDWPVLQDRNGYAIYARPVSE